MKTCLLLLFDATTMIVYFSLMFGETRSRLRLNRRSGGRRRRRRHLNGPRSSFFASPVYTPRRVALAPSRVYRRRFRLSAYVRSILLLHIHTREELQQICSIQRLMCRCFDCSSRPSLFPVQVRRVKRGKRREKLLRGVFFPPSPYAAVLTFFLSPSYCTVSYFPLDPPSASERLRPLKKRCINKKFPSLNPPPVKGRKRGRRENEQLVEWGNQSCEGEEWEQCEWKRNFQKDIRDQ